LARRMVTYQKGIEFKEGVVKSKKEEKPNKGACPLLQQTGALAGVNNETDPKMRVGVPTSISTAPLEKRPWKLNERSRNVSNHSNLKKKIKEDERK